MALILSSEMYTLQIQTTCFNWGKSSQQIAAVAPCPISLVMRTVARNAAICTAGGHNLDSEDDHHQVSSGTNIRIVKTSSKLNATLFTLELLGLAELCHPVETVQRVQPGLAVQGHVACHQPGLVQNTAII